MVDVKEYLKSAGGNWLRADNVQVGDKLKITGAGEIDDKTFDRSYLVLPVVLMRTSEEFQLRLGPKNVNRITGSFKETDTNKWVNRLLEVISIETFKGLGTKGILLRGYVASEGAQSQPKGVQLNIETIDFIRKSKDIIDAGIALNESDFNVLPAGVRAQLLKYGLVEKQVQGDVTQYSFKGDKCKPFLT